MLCHHAHVFMCIFTHMCHLPHDLLPSQTTAMPAGLSKKCFDLPAPQHRRRRITAGPAAAVAAVALAESRDHMVLLANIRWPAVAGALAAGLGAIAFADARRKTRCDLWSAMGHALQATMSCMGSGALPCRGGRPSSSQAFQSNHAILELAS